MGDTIFASGSAQAVDLYSKMTFMETSKRAFISSFLGKAGDMEAVLVRIDDLEKHAGEQIFYDLLMEPTGAGVTGDNEMRNNEEPMVYHQDSVFIDQLRNAHAWGRMSQQRTLHNLRKDAAKNLGKWFAKRYDEYMFRNLCGDTTMTHGQTAVVPDTDHFIVTGDVTHNDSIVTAEASISADDQIELADLDFAKEKGKTITPMMVPTIVNGKEYFVAVLHTYCMTDLRLGIGTTSGYVKWQDIQQYANRRGLKNPIFTNADGVYNGIILYDSSRIFSPVSTVYRNLFLGAQAGVFAIGSAYDRIDQKKFGKLPMSWEEDARDFKNNKAIAVGSIFGMKASRFNDKFFGAMVMSSYGALHN